MRASVPHMTACRALQPLGKRHWPHMPPRRAGGLIALGRSNRTMYGTDYETAGRLAELANRKAPRPSGLGSNRTVTRYERRGFAWDEFATPYRWGIWPRWVYDDRPDLPEFGGPFI